MERGIKMKAITLILFVTVFIFASCGKADVPEVDKKVEQENIAAINKTETSGVENVEETKESNSEEIISSVTATMEAAIEADTDVDMEFTLGQENAIKQAQSYLAHSAFSRTGLIEQLTSEYGSGYEMEDAEYAIEYLEDNGLVDWNAEAIEQAESYLSHSSFSRDGLFEQLTSEYGSQFTDDEAEQAITYLEEKALVDWNAEAVEQAESYLEHSSFSRDGLIEQMTSEYGSGFTQEQAEYAASQVGY